MNEKNMKQLKMALMEKKPIDVYFTDGNKFYDTFYYVPEKDIYQGDFGCMKFEDAIKISQGIIKHIKLEVHN